MSSFSNALRQGWVAFLVGLLVLLLVVVVAFAFGASPVATRQNSASLSAPATPAATQATPEAIDPNAGLPDNTQHVPVGRPAPDFSLHGIDGKNYTLSDYKGKVVVLEFIATWCPHCQNYASLMDDLYKAYQDRGVQIFSINASPNGHTGDALATTSDLEWFRDNFDVEYPLLFDKTLKSAADYGINSYPSLYIVDKEGKIAFQPPEDRLPSYGDLAGTIDNLIKK